MILYIKARSLITFITAWHVGAALQHDEDGGMSMSRIEWIFVAVGLSVVAILWYGVIFTDVLDDWNPLSLMIEWELDNFHERWKAAKDEANPCYEVTMALKEEGMYAGVAESAMHPDCSIRNLVKGMLVVTSDDIIYDILYKKHGVGEAEAVQLVADLREKYGDVEFDMNALHDDLSLKPECYAFKLAILERGEVAAVAELALSPDCDVKWQKGVVRSVPYDRLYEQLTQHHELSDADAERVIRDLHDKYGKPHHWAW